jgi:uncharacterized protein
MASVDPILQKFRQALDQLYGERIERVVLFGSRARGDAKADSDYNVALFLKGPTDTWEEIDRLTDLQIAMRDDTGADIRTIPLSSESWAKRTPLMFEIRKDGVDL